MTRPRLILVLEDHGGDSDPPPEVRVRRLLKRLWRTGKLRAVSMRDVSAEARLNRVLAGKEKG